MLVDSVVGDMRAYRNGSGMREEDDAEPAGRRRPSELVRRDNVRARRRRRRHHAARVVADGGPPHPRRKDLVRVVAAGPRLQGAHNLLRRQRCDRDRCGGNCRHGGDRDEKTFDVARKTKIMGFYVLF